MLRFNRKLLAVSADMIQERLVTYFGTNVNVDDISGGCGASFSIRVESGLFQGTTLPKQHKMVVACLKGNVDDANFPKKDDQPSEIQNLFVDKDGNEEFHSLTIKTVKA
eukprot:TRINITY_DN6917_c1_g1_i1.p1 TRINITY_DN6917_c1_g1~~TRINITY_DN6917_c1_g1_i1.p1  ORF type:complete len:128 (+),score=33.24 TRINITY_DN6917_c1_g1_i1:60-386(+)